MIENEPIDAIDGECEEVLEPIPELATKGVVIFDIDNTLTDTRHRDHKRPTTDMSKASSWREFTSLSWMDGPIYETMVILFGMAALNHKIVLKTGRAEEFRLMTTNWLGYLGLPFDALIMLPDDFDGDYGAWKASMLDHPDIGGAANVVFAFDDHPDSVEAYTKAGVICYKVPPYNGPVTPSPLANSRLYDGTEE